MNAQDLNLQPGDVITVRATVGEVIEGVGVCVELFSKTDQYHAWVREDLVVARLVEAADADEPPVRSYVEITPTDPADPPAVWRRDAVADWTLVNHEDVAGYPWRELKMNAKSWRLLHNGDDNR